MNTIYLRYFNLPVENEEDDLRVWLQEFHYIYAASAVDKQNILNLVQTEIHR